MMHFLTTLKSLLIQKPYLSALVLSLFLLADNSLLATQLDRLDEFEGQWLGLLLGLFIIAFVIWAQTRIYKFYLSEKRKWWLDKGDIKASVFVIAFMLITMFFEYLTRTGTTYWWNHHGMNVQVLSFMRVYSDYVISVIFYSILFKIITFYPISMVAGDHLTLVESTKKLGHYVWLLIAISLFASFIELKKQVGTQDLQLFWDVAKGLTSYVSLICTITAYKIQVIDKKQIKA
ncbi:MAG TPA: hypothetical protein DHW10_04770 [Rhodospirillaceae bacterium]|nr:hypothetical protein [Rhodospirillaceae bacterium]